MILKIWQTLGGRKFLAFAAATVLLIADKISENVWLWAFGIYCAANIVKAALPIIKKVTKTDA
jgi:hypothetical protein